jgi:hypothetical protein
VTDSAERAAFERWAILNGYYRLEREDADHEGFDQVYCDASVHAAWAAWQARASTHIPAGEPKPVAAWRYKDARGHWRYTGNKPEWEALKPEPLFAATPPAAPPAHKVVPLSDEQIEAIALEHEHMGFGRVGSNELSMHAFGPDALRAFVRDIEAALSAAPSDPKA